MALIDKFARAAEINKALAAGKIDFREHQRRMQELFSEE